MRRQQGFSLLELIIVVAMVFILIGLAAPRYLEWRANTITTEAAQQLASDIDGQRTEAKRQNAVRRVSATVGNDFYTLESVADDGTVTSQTVDLPNGTQIAAVPTNTVEFSPPYATIPIDLSTFEIEWVANTNIDRDVNVVGVMGKVVIR